MKVVDLNVLLYSVNADSPHHAEAHGWLTKALNGQEPIGFCWAVLLGYVRISTNPRIFPNAASSVEAIDDVRCWLSSEMAVVVGPGTGHLELLDGILQRCGTAGNLVTDGHIAALAVELGAEVATFDNDFHRFDGVRVFRPAG
ncbi:type II toxin-antitoxin system VapC family toxin [Nocardia sp. IBHARD005]|uniref:TA system VapC family ribonuclease toxin n=1 Tax=Nocardia sp. IBHARD005 TaxID=3457765 RepID=UPI004058ADCE